MSDRLDGFVDALDRAWERAESTPAPSSVDATLTLHDAYEIQDRLVARRIAPGNERVGWKLGLTASPSESGPIVGTILESMVAASGASFSLSTLVAPKVEGEVIVVIGEDLDATVTIDDLASGPHRIAAGIELIDYRTANATGPVDWVADNATVGAGVVGPSRPVSELSPSGIEVAFSRDGMLIASGRGDLVMGNPLAAVEWLAGHLGGRGLALCKGDVVLTGSLTGAHPVPAGVGSSFRAEFSGLGAVEVGFVP